MDSVNKEAYISNLQRLDGSWTPQRLREAIEFMRFNADSPEVIAEMAMLWQDKVREGHADCQLPLLYFAHETLLSCRDGSSNSQQVREVFIDALGSVIRSIARAGEKACTGLRKVFNVLKQRDVINIEIFTRWVETLQSVEEEIGVAVPQQEQQQPKVPVDDREVQKLVAAKLFGAAPKAKYFEEYLEEARFRERIEATFSVIGMIERMAAVDRIVTTRAQFVNYLQTALDEERSRIKELEHLMDSIVVDPTITAEEAKGLSPVPPSPGTPYSPTAVKLPSPSPTGPETPSAKGDTAEDQSMAMALDPSDFALMGIPLTRSDQNKRRRIDQISVEEANVDEGALFKNRDHDQFSRAGEGWVVDPRSELNSFGEESWRSK